jgi:hypothetical protein
MAEEDLLRQAVDTAWSVYRACTFWYTSQYYATTSTAGWRTRIQLQAPRLRETQACDRIPLRREGRVWYPA